MPILSESLIFAAADALQLDLHTVGEGIKAHENIQLKVGPWEIRFDMRVKSDYLSNTAAAFFVQLRKDLWLYLVAYDNGNAVKLMVFDAAMAKMTQGFMSTACGQGDIKKSVKHLLAAHAVLYAYDNKTNTWGSTANMDDVLALGLK